MCWGAIATDTPGDIGTVTQISTGFGHACAVKTAGTVVCWGDDSSDQLGRPLAITSAAPGSASGAPYTHALTTTGSLAPTFTVTAGALPPGLAIAGGQIAGTPTQSGDFTGTITASDGVFAPTTQNFSIAADVDAPVTTDDVPAGS